MTLGTYAGLFSLVHTVETSTCLYTQAPLAMSTDVTYCSHGLFLDTIDQIMEPLDPKDMILLRETLAETLFI